MGLYHKGTNGDGIARMLDDLSKIIAALKYWNLDRRLFPKDNYVDRFLLQKLTYLCQSLGLNIDYPFGIYLAGPYSKALADAYYQHPQEIASLTTEYKPNKQDIEIFERIHKYILMKKVKGDRKMEFLEAVATIQKLIKDKRASTEDEMYSQTKRLKPHLSDYIITIALNTVKQLNFRSEYLTDELREEFELWDRID